MRNRAVLTGLALVLVTAHAACSSDDPSATSETEQTSSASRWRHKNHDAGAGDAGTTTSTDAGSTGTTTDAGTTGTTTPPPPSSSPTDLCAGLVTDKLAHPMTSLAKPALGATVTDAEFKTKIRRITSVTASGSNPVLKPLYTTVSAWNADESRLLLFNVDAGRHELYDGRTYAFVRGLGELNPADIEQLYWSTTDPDVLYLVEGRDFIAYHVGSATKEKLTTFSFCSSNATGGSDPMFTSFDASKKRIGLKCGGTVFVYDIGTNTVLGQKAIAENPAQVSASGTLAYLSDSGRVTDASLNVLRTLDMANPSEHASLGRWSNGVDYWAGAAFDPGRSNDDVGNLVTFDLTNGVSRTIIGPKTGYPYPPDGHVSSLAYKNPGWAVVSTYGKTTGAGLLDLEIAVANTQTGTVCRVGRHRSWGKANTHLAEPYWAEAHATPSPSGTRIVFASDWNDGATVDSYVVELPSYAP